MTLTPRRASGRSAAKLAATGANPIPPSRLAGMGLGRQCLNGADWFVHMRQPRCRYGGDRDRAAEIKKSPESQLAGLC